jgi:hypothetical protein
MKKTSLKIAALLLVAGSTQAISITQTNTFSGTPNYSNALTFTKFDTQGGNLTLTGIRVSVFLLTEAQGGVGIDNDGATAASGTVTMGTKLNLAMRTGGPRLLNEDAEGLQTLFAITSKSMSLTGDDGDSTVFSTSGTDYDVMNIAETQSSNYIDIGESYWSRYVGTGNYSFDALVEQSTDFSSFGGSQTLINPMSARGNVVVTYNFIPEPASASMAILVLIAGFWVRRRFID